VMPNHTEAVTVQVTARSMPGLSRADPGYLSPGLHRSRRGHACLSTHPRAFNAEHREITVGQYRA
jgi:hypothetical protein